MCAPGHSLSFAAGPLGRDGLLFHVPSQLRPQRAWARIMPCRRDGVRGTGTASVAKRCFEEGGKEGDERIMIAALRQGGGCHVDWLVSGRQDTGVRRGRGKIGR